MGPWEIAGVGMLSLALLVLGAAVWRFIHHQGTRAAPVRAAEAIPDIRGSMSLADDPQAARSALEVAHDDCWAGLPPWARPSYPRQAPYGWESGAGTARPGGGWDFHEWDPWRPAGPEPGVYRVPAGEYNGFAELWAAAEREQEPPAGLTRLADTGDVMDARLAADVAAELHRQDADAELFLVGLAGRHGLAVAR